LAMDGLPDKLFTDFTSLKKKNPGLKTIIAIGGWTHNDLGPLQKAFSNMFSSKAGRARFIQNLMSFGNMHLMMLTLTGYVDRINLAIGDCLQLIEHKNTQELMPVAVSIKMERPLPRS
jgi:hypothetical protein